MSLAQIKDAKLNFIETGRLNRNIVRNEVALSWYKCNINQMQTCDSIRCHKSYHKNQYEDKYLHFIDAIIPAQLDYYLCDQDLNVESSRTSNYTLDQITNIDELCIGTNAGAVSKKISKNYVVQNDEHFLNMLNNYVTVGIPLKKEETVYGILMLLSDHTVNEFVIREIEQHVKSYHEKGVTFFTRKDRAIQLEDFIAYPTSMRRELEEKLNSIKALQQPVLIESSQGNGKTSLAWYLLLSQNFVPEIMNARETPAFLHEYKIKKLLNESETVIIDNLQDLEMRAGKYLLEYIENFYRTKSKTYYKCKTMVFTLETLLNQANPILRKITDRMKTNKIILKGFQDFEALDIKKDISNQLQKRYNTFLNEEELLKRFNLEKKLTFESFIHKCLLSEQKYEIKDLETMEYEYIKNVYMVLDENASLTAEKLQISRSTLYRKLNKFQNKTKS